MWRGLDEEAKSKYFELEKESKATYAVEKAKYMKAKIEYDKTHVPSAPSSKKSKEKKAKAPKGPKRAWPPFFFFQDTRRASIKQENPDKTHKEIIVMLGEEWRGLSEEQKQPYVDK